MESLIAVIVAVTLLLVGGLTVFETAVSTQDEIMQSWQEMAERIDDQARTILTPITATTKNAGSIVEVTLRNDGSAKLADFDDWDVILQYYTDTSTYKTDWYPYTAGLLGNNQWTMAGIYMDADTVITEVFEPGILNPGEELVMQINVMPTIGMTTTNLLSISTDNGIRASTIITR
jgi:archaellum component FlaF (FlaF/FlaG flagellin family)